MNKVENPTAQDIKQKLGLDGEVGTTAIYRNPYILSGVFLLLAALLTVYFTSSGPVEYRTTLVERQDLVVRVSATGTIKPVNQVEIGAEISGLIREVHVDFNSRVSKDQPLARLDTDQLEAKVIQGEASLDSAKATLAEAIATLSEISSRRDRTVDLAKRRAKSQQDVEIIEAEVARAEAAVEKARAQVKVSEATLKSDRSNLGKAVIRSPIDGIVLDRTIEPGQTVASSFQTPVLFSIAEDLRKMRLHVDVDEADIGQVKEAQKANFAVDAYPNRLFSAEVLSVRNAPRTIQGVVTYEAVLAVQNEDLALRPGMTATAEIIVDEITDTVAVSNGALRFTMPPATSGGEAYASADPTDPSSKVIWVLENGAPSAVTVRVGASDGNTTEITSDELAPGTRVITDIVTNARS